MQSGAWPDLGFAILVINRNGEEEWEEGGRERRLASAEGSGLAAT